MRTVVLQALFTESPYACGKVITRIETPLNSMIPWLLLVLSVRHRERQSLIDDDYRPEWIVKISYGNTTIYNRKAGLTFEELR